MEHFIDLGEGPVLPPVTVRLDDQRDVLLALEPLLRQQHPIAERDAAFQNDLPHRQRRLSLGRRLDLRLRCGRRGERRFGFLWTEEPVPHVAHAAVGQRHAEPLRAPYPAGHRHRRPRG